MNAYHRHIHLDERARAYIEKIPAPRTRENAATALRAFYAFRIASTNPLAWKDMRFDVLSNFAAWLNAQRYDTQSVKTYIAYVTKYLRFAKLQGWLPETFSMDQTVYWRKENSPRSTYPIPEPSERLPELLSYYDRRALATGDTWKARQDRLVLLRARAIVWTLFASCGRVSEVSALKRSQVQDGRISKCVIVGKGEKGRYLFLTREAQHAIQAYCNERQDAFDGLFVSHGRDVGKPLTRQMLWRIVADAAASLGFSAHPHDFRHYRARQMLADGIPLEDIQAILGHADIGTTRRVYAQSDPNRVQEMFERGAATALQRAAP